MDSSDTICNRLLRWGVWGLLAVELVLAWLDWIELGQAMAILVVAELGVLAITVWRVWRVTSGGTTSGGWRERVSVALALLMPAVAVQVLMLELRLWTTLGGWILRCPLLPGQAFSYRRRSNIGVLTLLVLLTAPVELLAMELLVPWPWVRWVLLVGGLYGILWVIGLAVSFRRLPHMVVADAVVLRYGLLAEVVIPWDAVRGAVAREQAYPGRRDGLHVMDGEAWLVVGGRVDATVWLRRPLPVRRALGWTPPVGAVHVAVDDPAGFVAALSRGREDVAR